MTTDDHWTAPDYPPPTFPPAVPWPQAYPQAYPQAPTNGLAVTALVLGIVGVVFAFLPILDLIGIVLGILAIIFGAIAWNRAGKGRPRKVMAIWGTSLGIATVVLAIVILAVFAATS